MPSVDTTLTRLDTGVSVVPIPPSHMRHALAARDPGGDVGDGHAGRQPQWLMGHAKIFAVGGYDSRHHHRRGCSDTGDVGTIKHC